jgi:protoheme IX farnesyltransferase
MSLLSQGAELSPQIAAEQAGLGPSLAGVDDFIALMKPRVMSLVVFTALVGLLVAPGHLHPVLGFAALLCIAVGAGAAGVLNMWYDADIDAVMSRTARRPIPAGRVSKGEALGFGITLAAGSVLVLGLVANWIAAGLLAFTIFFYAVIYTIWLKRSTPQNIVIGGAAGAFPPMIGWAAATGTIGLESVFLFLIIFLWTPPHFWALALCRAGDYERAGVPMLPVVAGTRETIRQIRLYSLVLIPVGIAPWLIGAASAVYGVTAALAGALLLAFAWRVRSGGREAKALFGYSILYLFVLFAMLLVDHVLFSNMSFSSWGQILAAR